MFTMKTKANDLPFRSVERKYRGTIKHHSIKRATRERGIKQEIKIFYVGSQVFMYMHSNKNFNEISYLGKVDFVRLDNKMT